MVDYKLAQLAELEKLSRQGHVDLFHGDESGVCSEGYVPYGWQFEDEQVSIAVEKGHRINCWGLVSRQNQCHWAVSLESIGSQFVFERLDALSLALKKETFVVLDNARIHTARLIKAQLPVWQKRGLFIVYLPTYSPHLNIAETLWRKLKKEWLVPEDYLENDSLSYAVNRCLANVGKNLVIHFSDFSLN